MKIAIVHDFLKEYGGAERVVEAMHEIWPEAPIYTAFVDYEGLGPHADRIRSWNIKTTWAQSIPFISKLYSPLRFLAPFFFRSLDLSDYDVIISSTNAYYAKGVIKGKKQLHICYCHTPPRSLYGYPTAMDWRKNPIIRAYGTIINHFLRIYDFKIAQGVDYFIANSREVQHRVAKFYRRDAVVIYPPVAVGAEVGSKDFLVPQFSREGSASLHQDIGARKDANAKNFVASPRQTKRYTLYANRFYLYVGKLAYAKHVDLAIETANRLKIPLKIVGKGGEEERLRKLAGQTVEFLGEVTDEQLQLLYSQCKALIFPAEDEDFGIVPVEAMAHGVSVIAHRSGGVVESVVDGKTGVFFDELTVESLVNAIRKLNDLNHLSMKEDCIRQAKKFSKERFKKEIKAFVLSKVIHKRI